MGSTCFKQYDSRWGSNPYAGGTMRGDGCGPTAMASIIYAKDTSINPWTIACWLTNNGYASNGSGTYWSGIKAGFEAYGFPCTNHPTMSTFFDDLAKGNYWGVILFSAGTRGGVTWTTGGHFVAVRDYKYEGGKHWMYMADPGGRDHDGWYNYEDHMQGLCLQVWTCYLPGWTPGPSPTPTPSGKLTVDGNWGVNTSKALQKVLGTVQDGIISAQSSSLKKYHMNCLSESFRYISSGYGGSSCIYALQKMLNLSDPDGQLGPNTISALQTYLGLSGPDGYCGPNTVKALQNWLNTKI